LNHVHTWLIAVFSDNLRSQGRFVVKNFDALPRCANSQHNRFQPIIEKAPSLGMGVPHLPKLSVTERPGIASV
jgi:hypothetical protein